MPQYHIGDVYTMYGLYPKIELQRKKKKAKALTSAAAAGNRY